MMENSFNLLDTSLNTLVALVTIGTGTFVLNVIEGSLIKACISKKPAA